MERELVVSKLCFPVVPAWAPLHLWSPVVWFFNPSVDVLLPKTAYGLTRRVWRSSPPWSIFHIAGRVTCLKHFVFIRVLQWFPTAFRINPNSLRLFTEALEPCPIPFSPLLPAFFKLSPPIHNLCTSHSLSWKYPFPSSSLAWVFPVIQSSSATSSKTLHLAIWHRWSLCISVHSFILNSKNCHNLAFILLIHFLNVLLPLLTPRLHRNRTHVSCSPAYPQCPRTVPNT